LEGGAFSYAALRPQRTAPYPRSGDELLLLARAYLLPGNRDQAGPTAGDRFHLGEGAALGDDELLAVGEVGQRREPAFRRVPSPDRLSLMTGID